MMLLVFLVFLASWSCVILHFDDNSRVYIRFDFTFGGLIEEQINCRVNIDVWQGCSIRKGNNSNDYLKIL